MGGERVYRVVWEPLLQGKFGDLAEEVAAVWFWNKLKLELTRFRGHLTLWGGGIHHAEMETAPRFHGACPGRQ